MIARFGLLVTVLVVVFASMAAAAEQERQQGWFKRLRASARAAVDNVPSEPVAPEFPSGPEEPFGTDPAWVPSYESETPDGEPAARTLRQRLRDRRLSQLERQSGRLRRMARDESNLESGQADDSYVPETPRIDSAPAAPRELGLDIDFGDLQPPPIDAPTNPRVNPPSSGATSPEMSDSLPLEINIPLPDESDESASSPSLRDRIRGIWPNRSGS